MSATQIVIAGHVTHDRYGAEIVPGGCAFYGARTQAALGADVHLVTAVGADFACEDAFAGLTATVARGGVTTLFTNLYPEGALRVQRIEATAPAVAPPPRLPDGALVHLAPVLQELDLAAWLDACAGHQVAIAIQGWIKDRGPGEAVVQTPWDVDGALLARVAFAACGEEDLVEQGDLLDRLCRHVPIVAFTHGARGCDVIVRGTTTRVGIYPHATEVDPTGAGDTFAAGFFLGLAEGRDPVAAAKLGAAAASIVVEGRGGATLPRVGEARARVAAIG
ncbi:MAG: sugar kinase [Myxococcales bacterium]|nr:sugar kinase [Myxococcales bacterium]